MRPLEVAQLSFRYRARPKPAIRDVTFQLEPGQMLLIAGASGSGKTTLARSINGLIPHSYKGELTGSVRLYGEQVGSLTKAEIAQRVGTLLQDPERQIVGAYVENEVAFGLENLGVPRADMRRRIEQVLEQLRIEHLKGRETFSLSAGEKQKVALAGALAMDPSILLLDEPLASLDPASAREALALFRYLADQGKTVIIVEHRVEDVLSVDPDLVMYLEQGVVKYFGDRAGLLEQVDYRQVKLPASVIIQLAANEAHRPVPRAPAGVDRPLVEFQQVSFSYMDGPPVLHDIDLSLHAGERVAVLGANGAGKTTLLKLALGLLVPKSGRVIVCERDTRQASVAELARSVGYVFQNPRQMLFAPTVEQELAFGPENLGQPEREVAASVRRAVEILNLQGNEDYPPLALSFGQQKRVSIAAVVALGSAVLIMDEPTAGQDYWNYMSFMEGILALPDFACVVFITHDLDLAIAFATRLVLLSEGRIVANGPPEEVLIDRERLKSCNIVPTSLLEENLKRLDRTGQFMRAEALAQQVAQNGGR